MTYSLNGIPFDNDTYGWSLQDISNPLADLDNEITAMTLQGRHGVMSNGPGVLGAPVLTFVVQCPQSTRQTLEALARMGGTLTSDFEPGAATVEFVSASPRLLSVAGGRVNVSITFRIPGAAARGPDITSSSIALGAASVPVTGLLPGLALEVQDAVIRVKGSVTGLQVTDSGGSWFTYSGAISGSSWLRFESATGRAFLTGTDTWSGGVEVSGAVDFGGPRGLFEIAPSWVADPSVRSGQLTVATATRSGASVQVRGRAAHLV